MNEVKNGNKILTYMVYLLLAVIFSTMTFLYVNKGNVLQAGIDKLDETKLDSDLYERIQEQQSKYIGEKLDTIQTDIKSIQLDVKALERRSPGR